MILSIGTGHSLKELKEAELGVSLDWGLQQWAPKLLDLLMEANQLSNEVNLKLLLKSRYNRIDVQFDSEVALDAVDALEHLVTVADAVDLTEAEEFILKHFVGDSSSPWGENK